MTKRVEGLQQAIAYLQLYKSRYPFETLKQQLEQNGYPKDIIEAAIAEVFLGKPRQSVSGLGLEGVKGSFFDFRHRKVYTAFWQKFVDFLIGFFGTLFLSLFLPGILRLVLQISSYRSQIAILSSFVVLAGAIAGIIYFWKRRHYLARGILVFTILMLIGGLFGGGVLYYLLRSVF